MPKALITKSVLGVAVGDISDAEIRDGGEYVVKVKVPAVRFSADSLYSYSEPKKKRFQLELIPYFCARQPRRGGYESVVFGIKRIKIIIRKKYAARLLAACGKGVCSAKAYVLQNRMYCSRRAANKNMIEAKKI